jgi:hypothetical protein
MVYDVPQDCRTPVRTFPSLDRISSSAFVRQEEELFVLIGTRSGRLQILPFETTSAVEPTSTLLAWKPLTVSVSNESGLVFLSGPGAIHLQCSRFLDLMRGTDPEGSMQCRPRDAPVTEAVVFVATAPGNPAFHLMRGIESGSLLALEFTDAGTCYTPLVGPAKPLSGLERIAATFAVFPSGETIGAIGADGAFYRLLPGLKIGIDRVNFESPVIDVAVEDGQDYRVPPTFWSQARLSRDSVIVLDDRGRDVTRPQGWLANQYGPRVGFTAQSQSGDCAIVGIRICFPGELGLGGSRNVKVMNRRYVLPPFRSPRMFAFPLKPDEICSEQVVRVA